MFLIIRIEPAGGSTQLSGRFPASLILSGPLISDSDHMQVLDLSQIFASRGEAAIDTYFSPICRQIFSTIKHNQVFEEGSGLSGLLFLRIKVLSSLKDIKAMIRDCAFTDKENNKDSFDKQDWLLLKLTSDIF